MITEAYITEASVQKENVEFVFHNGAVINRSINGELTIRNNVLALKNLSLYPVEVELYFEECGVVTYKAPPFSLVYTCTTKDGRSTVVRVPSLTLDLSYIVKFEGFDPVWNYQSL